MAPYIVPAAAFRLAGSGGTFVSESLGETICNRSGDLVQSRFDGGQCARPFVPCALPIIHFAPPVAIDMPATVTNPRPPYDYGDRTCCFPPGRRYLWPFNLASVNCIATYPHSFSALQNKARLVVRWDAIAPPGPPAIAPTPDSSFPLSRCGNFTPTDSSQGVAGLLRRAGFGTRSPSSLAVVPW